jgi:hypothetical protein
MDFKKVLLATALVTNATFAADEQPQARSVSVFGASTIATNATNATNATAELAAADLAAKEEMNQLIAQITYVDPTAELKSAHDKTLKAFINLPVRAELFTPDSVSKKNTDKSLATQAARVMRALATHAKALTTEIEGKFVMTQEELDAKIAEELDGKLVMTQEELDAKIAEELDAKIAEKLDAKIAEELDGKLVMTQEELDAKIAAALLEQV